MIKSSKKTHEVKSINFYIIWVFIMAFIQKYALKYKNRINFSLKPVNKVFVK